MKRFSPEGDVDREFEIGGEIFKWRVPYWEEIANRLDKDVEMATKAVNGDAAEKVPEGAEDMPTTAHGVVEDFIKRIEMFIDPEEDSIKRWRSLAKRKNPAIPMNTFREVHQWLLEVTTNRDPTEQSSPS